MIGFINGVDVLHNFNKNKELYMQRGEWCPGPDLNRHGHKRGPRILSPLRLPFRHPGTKLGQ